MLPTNQMRFNPRSVPLISVVVTFVAVQYGTFAQDTVPPAAEPKPHPRAITDAWADPPYVTTSQKMAERPSIGDLPVAGTIEWTLESLPFIDDGPRAGISGAAFVHNDGALYLAGGFIPMGDGTKDPSYRTSRWTHRYDLGTKTWTQLPDMPGRVEYTRGISQGDHVYVVAGGTQKKPPMNLFTASSDVFQLSNLAGTPAWSKHSRLNVPRTHPAAGAVGDYLIVAGGNESHYDKAAGILGMHTTTMRDTTEVLDLANPAAGWQKKAPIPAGPRGWMASATVGEEFFVFGGIKVITRAHDGGQVRMKLQDTLSYNPKADRWTAHTPVPFAISGWEADVYADRYVIFVGGIQQEVLSPEKMGQNTFNDMVFVYDTLDARWMRLDGLVPVGGVYNDTGVVIVGDTIYALGGEGPRGSHFDQFAIGKITLSGEAAGPGEQSR